MVDILDSQFQKANDKVHLSINENRFRRTGKVEVLAEPFVTECIHSWFIILYLFSVFVIFRPFLA